MKCLVALDCVRTDIIYLDCDEEFNAMLQEQAKKVYGDEYIPEDPSTPDLDIATSYFLAFVTIQNKQEQLNNPVQMVTCQDGMIAAFHRFDNIDVVVVNGNTSSKDVVVSQCVMFEKIAKLHLGPATLFLKPDDLELRKLLWGKISDYLNFWEDAIGQSNKFTSCSDDEEFGVLYEENFKQHFLFQAVEELHINPDLKKQSATLMIEALKSAQKIDKSYCKAVLVVNGKVLFSHNSTRQTHRLDPSDLLLILFIAHSSLPRSPVDIDYKECDTSSELKEYHQQTIFIRKLDQNDHYLPCTLTAVSIRAGIVLILLAESKTSIAPNICRAIQSLSKLYEEIEDLATAAERCEQDNVRIDTKNLVANYLKVKGVVDFYFTRMQKDIDSVEHLSQHWTKTLRDWHASSGIAGRLGEENRYLYEFDRRISDLITTLRRLFYAIYCKDDTTELHEDIAHIYKAVSVGLRDSASFLLVKSQRNFTLGNYLSDFPGIIHFVVINRTHNKVIVPCLGGGDGRSARYCHELIQCAGRFHRAMVRGGFLGGYMRKRDMLFSYKLWFQNGKKVVSPESSVPQYTPAAPSSNMLCMLYHGMVQHYFGPLAPLVDCYELLTVHIGDVPLEFVNEAATRLINVVCDEFAA